MTADPKPSLEAIEAADELMDRGPFRMAWRSDELQLAIALALDRFRAAGVAEERERCAHILARRAAAYAGQQALAIYNGSLIAKELNANARRIRETSHDR